MLSADAVHGRCQRPQHAAAEAGAQTGGQRLGGPAQQRRVAVAERERHQTRIGRVEELRAFVELLAGHSLVVAGGDLPVEEKRKGVSLLLINTAKGAQIFDVLPLHRQARTLEEAAACDAALRQPPTLTEERSKFFDALEQLPFQQVRTRYLSAVQHREGVGQRLRELLHRGGKEKKS